MPVNPLPIIIPLILGWIICVGLLLRWRIWAGVSFVGLTLAALIIVGMNLNVEQRINEEMPYRIVGTGRGAFVEFTTSNGDLVTVNSENIVSALTADPKPRAHVRMEAWYNFGRLHAYHVSSVEGERPSP